MNIKKQQGTTLVQCVCANVKGFSTLHKRLVKKIIASGKTISTLSNYMQCIAHVSLKSNCLPTQVDLEQIEDYLLHLKKKGASEADFKLTVYGFRFLFRCDVYAAHRMHPRILIAHSAEGFYADSSLWHFKQ